MTQKELLESLHSEVVSMKGKLPNGELVAIARDMKDMKEDISDLKYTLLNPEDGVVVKTNQNTYFMKANKENIEKIDELLSWKENVTKVLWILFTAIVGVVVKLIAMN